MNSLKFSALAITGMIMMGSHLSADPYFRDAQLNLQKDTLAQSARAIDADRLVVFGDSLSDAEGRFLQRSFGWVPDPKYNWGGRFSNGPLWIEYVTHALALPTLNYSISGARIRELDTLGSIPTLNWLDRWKVPSGYDQLASFAKDEGRFTDRDIVLVSLGPNDYLFDADASKVETYVADLTQLIEKSILLGATRIVTFKIPLGLKYMSFEAQDLSGRKVTKEALVAMTEKHNILLDAAMADLQARYPEVRLHAYGSDDSMESIRAHPESYGLDDIDTPCFTGYPLAGSNAYPLGGVSSIVCSNPRGHIYWDTAHPTTFVHCLSAVEVLSQMQSEGLVEDFTANDATEACKNIR